MEYTGAAFRAKGSLIRELRFGHRKAHSALIPFARQHDLPAGRKLVLQKMPVKPGRGEHPVFGQHFAGETGFTPVAQYRHAGDLGLNGNFVSVLTSLRNGAGNPHTGKGNTQKILDRRDAKGVKLPSFRALTPLICLTDI